MLHLPQNGSVFFLIEIEIGGSNAEMQKLWIVQRMVVVPQIIAIDTWQVLFSISEHDRVLIAAPQLTHSLTKLRTCYTAMALSCSYSIKKKKGEILQSYNSE